MKQVRLATSLFCLVLILAYALFLFFSWPGVPETVPTHFNAAGVADAYGSKWTLLMGPALALLLLGVFVLLPRFPQLWNFPVRVTAENRDRLYAISARMLEALKVLIVLCLLYTGLLCLRPGLSPWPVYLFLGLMLGAILLAIVQMFRAR